MLKSYDVNKFNFIKPERTNMVCNTNMALFIVPYYSIPPDSLNFITKVIISGSLDGIPNNSFIQTI